jgi:hypothetical protein
MKTWFCALFRIFYEDEQIVIPKHFKLNFRIILPGVNFRNQVFLSQKMTFQRERVLSMLGGVEKV